jgi:hypothetical protein
MTPYEQAALVWSTELPCLPLLNDIARLQEQGCESFTWVTTTPPADAVVTKSRPRVCRC